MTTIMAALSFDDFVKIGFNRNEAKVYFALIQYGKADARQLIKETGFHKNIVYDNLEKLIDKGLVSFIMETGRKVFVVQPADMLISHLEKEEQQISENKIYAEKLVKEIKKYNIKKPEENQATIFRGVQGLKLVLKDLLDCSKDYVSFGAPKESFTIMGETYWQNFRQKQRDAAIKAKIIFNESLRFQEEIMPSPANEIRYLKKAAEPMTQTIVYGDKTAIIVWAENPIVTLIKSEQVANSYKEFFKLLWKDAKP